MNYCSEGTETDSYSIGKASAASGFTKVKAHRTYELPKY